VVSTDPEKRAEFERRTARQPTGTALPLQIGWLPATAATRNDSAICQCPIIGRLRLRERTVDIRLIGLR